MRCEETRSIICDTSFDSYISIHRFWHFCLSSVIYLCLFYTALCQSVCKSFMLSIGPNHWCVLLLYFSPIDIRILSNTSFSRSIVSIFSANGYASFLYNAFMMIINTIFNYFLKLLDVHKILTWRWLFYYLFIRRRACVCYIFRFFIFFVL